MIKHYIKYCATLLIILFNTDYFFSQGNVSFIVFGDWGREGKYNQKEVAKQMGIYGEKLNISFIITTGDNFYPDGALSADSPQWQTSFENIYTASSLQNKWYVTLGNHDYHISPQPEIDYTQKSTRWYLPSRYYYETVNIESNTIALFLFMDTTPFIKSYYSGGHGDIANQDYSEQLRWADSILSNVKAEWKFITGHHPVITGGEHGDTKELVEYLKPLMEKQKVNAYFCGHDHDMQHLRVLDESVNYFVSGAGSSTRSCRDTEYTLFQKGNLSGFLAITLSAAKMECMFIDYQGNILYKTIINK